MMNETKEKLVLKIVKVIDNFWYGTSDDVFITSVEVPVTFNGVEDGLMIVKIIEEE